MTRTFTCILCPNGCEIQAEYEGKEVLSVAGNRCPRGEEYVRQELTAPLRNIATSVLVNGGELPLVSVRLTKPIPKELIFAAMEEIKKLRLTAPVTEGQVLISHLLGLETDVIATKDVAAL